MPGLKRSFPHETAAEVKEDGKICVPDPFGDIARNRQNGSRLGDQETIAEWLPFAGLG
jgi:hypothetical protein